MGTATSTFGLARIASTSAAAMLPGLSSRWKMELRTSWSFELRAPSTASKPPVTPVKARFASCCTIQTAISSPPASAIASAETSVETTWWRRLLKTMVRMAMSGRLSRLIELLEIHDFLELREDVAIVAHQQQRRAEFGAGVAEERQ